MNSTNLTPEYKAKRDSFMLGNEGFRTTVYFDTVGVATDGKGVSIVTRKDIKETTGRDFALNRDNLDEIAKVLGNGSIELGKKTKEYQDIEKFAQDVVDAINNTPEPKYPYDDKKKKYIYTRDAFEKSERGKKLVELFGHLIDKWEVGSSPTISKEQAEAISKAVVDRFEKDLDSKLKDKKINLDPNSLTDEQRIVLLDILYQGRWNDGGKQLAEAIRDGADTKELVDILLKSKNYKLYPNRINLECQFLEPQWVPRYPGILPDIRECNQLYNKASLTPSPIILDLDKDGVETTSLVDGTYFDHDGNGFMEQTAWVAPYGHDGLLVMDRDGNGSIDTGNELFGDQTILKDGSKAANGFQALADFDDNKDGKIDANDTVFNQLRVWEDFDGDGYSSADEELYTLGELGIESINTGYTNTNVIDANGNTIRQYGTFTRTDGTTSSAADVYFQVNTMYTIANEGVDVSPDIATLPNLQAYGNVYDLHQAMVRDTSGHLQGLVEQFIAETDSNVRHTLNSCQMKGVGCWL